MTQVSDERQTHPDGMDLFDGLGVIARRWYVVLPILIVAGVLAYNVHSDTTTTYSTTAVVGITTPSVNRQAPIQPGEATVTRTNALVNSGGITLIANLVVVAVQGESVEAHVVNSAPSASYDAALLTRNQDLAQLPVISLTVTAGSPRDASEAMALLLTETNNSTSAVQRAAGVPTQVLATSFVLQAPTSPVSGVSNRDRASASVAVAGLVVAVVAASVWHALAGRARRRRGRKRLQRGT